MFYNMFLHFLLLNLYKNPTVTFIRGTKRVAWLFNATL